MKLSESDFIDKYNEKRNYRSLMYVQQLEHLKLPIEQIQTNLYELFPSAEYDWAYIIHDKDKYVEDVEGEEVVNQKEPHIHISIYSRNGVSLSKLQKATGEEDSNSIEFMRNKNANFLYLTHNTKNAIQDGKYIYPVEEVVSNFDYTEFVGNHGLSSAERKDELERVIIKIGRGEITEADIFEVPDLYNLYLMNKRPIDDALSVYDAKVQREISTGEHPKKA